MCILCSCVVLIIELSLYVVFLCAPDIFNHFNLWLGEHDYFLCLQEDFVKWKGSLFYRFITTLVDEDVEIRKFGVFLFCFC